MGNYTVYVVEPDHAAQALIRQWVSMINLPCRAFATGREFFEACGQQEDAGCLVLETQVPDISGLQIQRRLSGRGSPLPLVFASSRNDVSLAVELMRGGAIHYLLKPLRPTELLGAVQEAMVVNRLRRRRLRRWQQIREGIAGLTGRERDVLRLLACGKAHRAIAEHLGVSARAVGLRADGMIEKLRLGSYTELLQFARTAKKVGTDCFAPEWPRGPRYPQAL